MNGVNGTEGVSWCWQDKSRLRLIRARFKDKERCAAQIVYMILTNISSDAGDSRFKTYRTVIASLAGIGRDRVTKALGHLDGLGLIKMSAQTRAKDGKFAALHITLTKGQMIGEAVGVIAPRTSASNPSRSESHTEATLHAASALRSHSSRDGLPVAGNPAYSVESNERKKEVVVTRARETETIPSLPADIMERLEVHLSPLVPPHAVVTFAGFVATHGAENVRAALREAQDHLVKPLGFIKYVRSVLENQQTSGYTWESKQTLRRNRYVAVDITPIPTTS